MAYNGAVFGGTLGSINVGLAAAVGLLGPLMGQLDFMLYGSIGIGALGADFAVQLSASLQASAGIALSIGNPFIGFQIALSAIVSLQAQIALALSGAIPAFSLEASIQLSANAALSANLLARIGGLELLIQAALLLKIPVLELLARLNLSAGPFMLVSWENLRLDAAGTQFALDASNGIAYGPNSVGAAEPTYGIVLFTKSPAAWASLQALLLT